MKITIIKYLDDNGKIMDIRKDIFKSSDLPKNIIEEYEVEIKEDKLCLNGTWCRATEENINKLEDLGYYLMGSKSEGNYVNIGRILYTYKGEKTGQQVHLVNDRFEYVQEGNYLKDLELKYSSGNYIKLWKGSSELKTINEDNKHWTICNISYYGDYDYKLIHNKHKDILEGFLKNPSVEIECTNNISKDADIETIWYHEENFIENYDENMHYRLKVKDLAWYEKEDNFRIAVKQIKSLNDFTEKDGKIYIMEKFTDDKGVSSYFTDGYHTPLQWLDYYRPAKESEVLSLVYKPQQKVSKEINLTESNRLKDLFLNYEAECLVENEQEFRLVYDFLNKTHDKKLNRYKATKIREFPNLILTDDRWGNILEWNRVEDRDLNKPLIKFDGEMFWKVSE